jgi:hypothetical protein
MKRREYLLAALKAGEYRRRAWLYSTFALIQEAPDAWKKEPYAYRVVQTPTGYFFVDPENNNELTQIDDATIGQPLFAVTEHIDLKAGDVPNLTKDLAPRVGNLLFNYIVVVYGLNSKLPFLEGKVTAGKIEDMILAKLKDTPENEADRKDSEIYVDDYLRFADAMFFLTCLSQICVPAATPKSMVPAPGIYEYRDKLIAEQPDRHNDPAFVAEVDAKLVAYDREYLKGDRSSDFYISGKSFDIVRKKRFGVIGAEKGIEENVSVKLIPKSLEEGWDIKHFPAMNDSLRTGSYNRGAQTVLGGESVKWLLRASSNIYIREDDCASEVGITRPVTMDNYKLLIGYYGIIGGKTVLLDEEKIRPFIGKYMVLRSPQYCHTEGTGYCKTCCGPMLSSNPTGLSMAVSDYGNAFLYMYMSAAHAKATKLAAVDIETAFT